MYESFIQALNERDVVQPSCFAPGTTWRYPAEGKRASNKSGSGKISDDGEVMFLFDHTTGHQETIHLKEYDSLTPEDKRRYAEQQKAAKLNSEKIQKDDWINAALQAKTIWDSLVLAPDDHPYLLNKGVKAHNARLHGNDLVIPLWHKRNLVSLQYINEDGTKKFMPGGRTKNAYFPIGDFKSDVICICEGFATGATIHEATGYSVAIAFNAGNLSHVANTVKQNKPDTTLVVCADNDAGTEVKTGINPGMAKATEAATETHGRVAIPSFADGVGGTDFNDLARSEGLQKVKEIITKVISEPMLESAEQTVQRLSKLSSIEYEQVREMEADTLGVRVSILDKEVSGARVLETDEEVTIVEEIIPWNSQVTGESLLEEIIAELNKYTYLPDGADIALATWILGTYCMDAWVIWPKVLITSPEKRCGKSTLMEVMEAFVYRALVASNISPSAIFRCVEEWQVSLLLDEADTFTKDNDELNGIINAGHRKRSARVIRSDKVADGFIPKAYSVWGSQVIAGIGTQRDTLHDRSIHIEMERKLPDEQVVKIPVDLFERSKDLRRKCHRWSIDNLDNLKLIPQEIPNYGNDRAQDNWEPLVRIGHIVGDKWKENLLKAYQIFTTATQEDEDAGILLLRDVKTIFSENMLERISSAELVEKLIGFGDSPWSEWKRGKPLTQVSIARLLKPFKIKPKTLRLKDRGNVAKGYDLSQFKNAFDRYLTPITPDLKRNTVTTPVYGAISDIESVTLEQSVTAQNALKPTPVKGCNVVTPQNTPIDEKVYREAI